MPEFDSIMMTDDRFCLPCTINVTTNPSDAEKGKKKGRSVSKDIFGDKRGRQGRDEKVPEMISHALPRIVNLQHSQI